MKLFRLLIPLLLASCGPAKNTNPCNMDVKIVKGKLFDHPDLEAFHVEVYVYEKDGKPPKNRMVRLSLNERLVSRVRFGNNWESIQVAHAGIAPQWILNDKGYFDLDILHSKKFGITILPFNEITIKARKGKTQKIFIYLEEITHSDCYDYIDKYQKANGIQKL